MQQALDNFTASRMAAPPRSERKGLNAVVAHLREEKGITDVGTRGGAHPAHLPAPA